MRAEFAQCDFQMIAGGDAFLHGRFAFGEKARQQDRLILLARSGSAAHTKFHATCGPEFLVARLPPSFVTILAPISASGIENPAHRASANDEVASDFRAKFLAGQNSGQQPNGGAGIFGIQSAARGFQSIQALPRILTTRSF